VKRTISATELFCSLSPTSTSCRQRPDGDIRAAAPEYPFATLIQSFTAAVAHDFLEQTPYSPNPIHQDVKFSKLSLAQLLPAF